ncbi:MAG TPA: GerMN domain-containing protein [Micromonosporaceae bacterium]|jgi:hypothetical protein
MTDFERELKAALELRAGDIDVSPDALRTIERRTRRRRHGFAWRGVMGAGATVMATVIAVTAGLGSCAPTSRPSPVAAPPSVTPATVAPASTKPSSSTYEEIAKVPIYYIGYIGGEPLLFREYHQVLVDDQRAATKLSAAIRSMLDGRTAADPDYASQWPASARVGTVSVSGTVATVDIDHATVNGYDPAGNNAALQQLIWTATAFTGATGVRLTFDGKSRSTLWAAKLPVAGVLHRGPAVDVLAPIWIIDPQQGAVSATNVTVHVAGIVFEGSFQLRVFNAAGKQVVSRSVQLSAGAPAQGTATVKLVLAPGQYTIKGYLVPLQDAPAKVIDSHRFTVR